MPSLSIITVVRNAAHSIAYTLSSVATIHGQDVEYLVLDGQSEDGTLDLIRAQAPWTDLLMSEPDGGIYDAMNKAARLAGGDWLYFLNAGDALHGDAVTALLELAQAQPPDVGAVSGRVDMLDADRRPMGYTHPTRTGCAEQLRHSNCVAHQATLMRATTLRELGGFRTDLRIMGDYDYWLRLVASGHKILFSELVVADFVADGVSSRRDRYIAAQDERLQILQDMGWMTAAEAVWSRLRIRAAFHTKSALRSCLGPRLSHKVAQQRARRA